MTKIRCCCDPISPNPISSLYFQSMFACAPMAKGVVVTTTTTKRRVAKKHQANNAEENSMVVVVHRVFRALPARTTTLKSRGYK